ncbi:hypothetical protein FHX08_000925 [Rhizobium sp. BK529]|uniref:hypothetical protein n=1 Tax=unclassified Rhizobium TaxID=2613769 RepID=UPI001047AD5C|nr:MULTISPECIES: hypothetical protein [unclassified Rhizobium]MBB3590581.1 hypothetical protein [Rhizobium sp. BK529]TCS05268.1 hypothetical protein EV281_103950 [Rhizobium sp. BK418]
MNPADDDFSQALALIPEGYSEGSFEAGRWGVTVKRSPDGKRIWLYAEDLAGSDIVSFNLYLLEASGSTLKPCEMSSAKVITFVHGYRPDKDQPMLPAKRSDHR